MTPQQADQTVRWESDVALASAFALLDEASKNDVSHKDLVS